MLPLLFVALVVGTVGAHMWLDSYGDDWLRRVRAEHDQADQQLLLAKQAVDPRAAIAHAQAAQAANRRAADQTAQAAKAARAPEQLDQLRWHADLVDARAGAIADTTADAHLDAAEQAVDPDLASHHVQVADLANQAAAQQVVQAAQAATQGLEQDAVQQVAKKVEDRFARIKQALDKLGVGECGLRTYARVTDATRAELMRRLRADGMTVTGENPWDIDTHKSGVKLRAVWDPRANKLSLIVSNAGLFGSLACNTIWEKIDPVMKELGA